MQLGQHYQSHYEVAAIPVVCSRPMLTCVCIGVDGAGHPCMAGQLVCFCYLNAHPLFSQCCQADMPPKMTCLHCATTAATLEHCCSNTSKFFALPSGQLSAANRHGTKCCYTIPACKVKQRARSLKICLVLMWPVMHLQEGVRCGLHDAVGQLPHQGICQPGQATHPGGGASSTGIAMGLGHPALQKKERVSLQMHIAQLVFPVKWCLEGTANFEQS